MAVVGKGGGKRKVFWTATCNKARHGVRGYKSSSTHWFVGMPVPRCKKPSKHEGCPQCKGDNDAR